MDEFSNLSDAAIARLGMSPTFLRDPRYRDGEIAWFRQKQRRAKEVMRAANRRRYRKTKGGVGLITGTNRVKILIRLLARQNGKCCWCAVVLPVLTKDMATAPVCVQVDHHIPLCRGGSHGMHNLRAVCAPCNGKKARMLPIQFAKLIAKDLI